jgi:hypothetical protein
MTDGAETGDRSSIGSDNATAAAIDIRFDAGVNDVPEDVVG